MALMTTTSRNHNSAFVPPLKLTQADAGQTGNVARCKVRLQVKDLETKVSANVSNIIEQWRVESILPLLTKEALPSGNKGRVSKIAGEFTSVLNSGSR